MRTVYLRENITLSGESAGSMSGEMDGQPSRTGEFQQCSTRRLRIGSTKKPEREGMAKCVLLLNQLQRPYGIGHV